MLMALCYCWFSLHTLSIPYCSFTLWLDVARLALHPHFCVYRKCSLCDSVRARMTIISNYSFMFLPQCNSLQPRGQWNALFYLNNTQTWSAIIWEKPVHYNGYVTAASTMVCFHTAVSSTWPHNRAASSEHARLTLWRFSTMWLQCWALTPWRSM